jgi:hypothetical protein
MGEKTKYKLSEIPTSDIGNNLCFQDEQNDNLQVEGVNVRFAYFYRVGMKNAKFTGGRITQSILEDVYARKAKFLNIDFTGTTFRNCNFEKATFSSCNFKYCKFENCQLPINEIVNSLPQEPNLRMDLANNLKTNFAGIGQKKHSDTLLDIEIEAEQKELKAIFLSKTGYYRERYDLIDRIESLLKLIKTQVSAFIWGYGHKVWRLLFSYCIIMLFFSALIFFFHNDYFIEGEGIERQLNLIESVFLVFASSINFPNIDYQPLNELSRIILFFVSFLGFVYLGLLAATLYRKIARL